MIRCGLAENRADMMLGRAENPDVIVQTAKRIQSGRDWPRMCSQSLLITVVFHHGNPLLLPTARPASLSGCLPFCGKRSWLDFH